MPSASTPTGAQLIRWQRLKPLLRLVAESVDTSEHHREQARRQLDHEVAQLRGSDRDDTDWAATLTEAVAATSADIVTPLDVADPPAEAILAWREYLLRGGSIRSLGRYLSRGSHRLVREWEAPERTVRERMWLSDQPPPSKHLTSSAWPGIQALLTSCETVLGLDLPDQLPPRPTHAPTSTGYPIPGDRSDFICDVTVADGTEFDKGEEFVKTWRICNTGTVPWTQRYLTRQGGAPGPGTHTSPERVPIPDTQPGQTLDITVPMRAALLPGTSASTWKMTDPAGQLCFPDRYRYGLRCEIVTRGSH